LLRALELSEECYQISRINFVNRILANPFTRKLYEELGRLAIPKSFPLAISGYLASLDGIRHINGTLFTDTEKRECWVKSKIAFGKREAEISESVKLVRKILNYKNKNLIPNLLYFFLNSRGVFLTAEFWYK